MVVSLELDTMEHIRHTFNAYFGIAQMKFTQGLMCAISAGMLIYAACVEMLAGDFVMDTTLLRSPVWKQTVALVSLLVGAAAMAVIG
jgi:zinc transporter 1/2/3